MLILYPVTLWNSFISSNSILVESLGFSIYHIITSAKSDSFTSLAFSSYCLIVLDRTFNAIFNRNGEGEHPCPVLVLEEKLSVFHH